MQAQISILERQRQELLTINEKWAKEYNIMVAFYQQELLSLRVSQRDHSDVVKETYQTKPCKREKLQPVNSELHKAVTEAEELRAHNHVLTKKGQQQLEEISRLNKALEERLHPFQTFEESRGSAEDLWKHQAEVFKEDFLKERGDREKLQYKYIELQKKLSKARDELHLLKSQATWTRILHPVVDCTCKTTAAPPASQRRRHPTRDN
ncbi:TNFAIP3-interacting protein 3-like [Syngnathus acus]|uniref:TNFAIP3-interacting protein 3-like n=1 Tax=Syngnathus acus TaxID=161584 RepID=UPI001885FEF5|nr:TNFAIP3-interacting protein 3-like [Syngnathus acus]XP_037136383.1 TNFAIP3-interacting protein 3-like [Syngnathus acus]